MVSECPGMVKQSEKHEANWLDLALRLGVDEGSLRVTNNRKGNLIGKKVFIGAFPLNRLHENTFSQSKNKRLHAN